MFRENDLYQPLMTGDAIGFTQPWVVMLLITVSLYLLLKILTLGYFEPLEKCRLPFRKRLAWLLAWPGMNPRHFFNVDSSIQKPPARAWLWAAMETVFGSLLMFVVAPRMLGSNELAAGWMAMIGVAFFFHFGLLQIVALCWRRTGRPVEPIMRAPVLATSLDEFWSRRWNLAFRDFASTFIVRPLYRRFGPAIALVGGFSFSGLLHDIAISIPARGGYGLPTAYFLLQGAGVMVERSIWGRTIGLGRGWRGWVFALLVTAPAAFFLFHPAFVREVIVPLIPSRGI